jgi:hypothetical protein
MLVIYGTLFIMSAYLTDRLRGLDQSIVKTHSLVPGLVALLSINVETWPSLKEI